MNRFFITGTLVEISEKSTANGMLFTRITVEESGATTFTDGKLPYFQILIKGNFRDLFNSIGFVEGDTIAVDGTIFVHEGKLTLYGGSFARITRSQFEAS